jgi:hypothetical protein
MPAEAFLDSLARAQRGDAPFAHWRLRDALPAEVVVHLAALPFSPPAAPRFDGRREANNSTRVYFSPATQAEHPVCAQVAAAFRDPAVIGAIQAQTGARLEGTRLRIEYCQDVDGFWLEPHLDIPVKRLTLLIHLSDDPRLAHAGTDLYGPAPDHAPAGRAEFGPGRGLIFIPGTDSWHGFSPRPIEGVRKSLIVNYVDATWRAVEELA